MKETHILMNVTATVEGFSRQQAEPQLQGICADSYFPPSVVSCQVHPAPISLGPVLLVLIFMHRAGDQPHSLSNTSPAEAARLIMFLKDKSVDELQKLLSDNDAYQQFLLSLDEVKTQNNVRDELKNETLQLVRKNLENEAGMMELRNQCRIIRMSELATAQEKLNDLMRKKNEIMKFYSPASLLHQLQAAMDEAEEESEDLHRQLLEKEIDVAAFVQKYKRLRNTYHRRAFTHLAAKTSITG